MPAKNTYVLTFKGEHVQTFESVHAEQAVLLGYRRAHAPGQHRLEIPKGEVGRKPVVVTSMKTVAALKRWTIPARFATYPGQTFMIRVLPGTTEIYDAEEVR